MKTHIYILLTTIILSGCYQKTKQTQDINTVRKPTSNTKLKLIKIGEFSFNVPENFQIHYSDSVNMPATGYLTNDKCYKMYFSSGFGNSEIVNPEKYKDFTIIQDTLQGILRFIAYKKTERLAMEIHIAKIKKLNMDKLGLENFDTEFIFNAMTNMGATQPSCLTSEEIDILVYEIMHGRLEK